MNSIKSLTMLKASKRKSERGNTNIIQLIKRKETPLNNVDDKKENLDHFTEKITCPKMLYFLLFLTSLILTTMFMMHIEETESCNRALRDLIKNTYETDSDFTIINEDLIVFNNMTTVKDFYNFGINNLIPALYDSIKGVQSTDSPYSNETFYIFQVITPLRIIQKRAEVLTTSDEYYNERWLKRGDPPFTSASFGKNGYIFNYTSSEGGFVYEIPVSYQGQVLSKKNFSDLYLKFGFYDSQTREIIIDFAVYNKASQYLIYSEIRFLFSATGFLKEKKFNTFSYPVAPYIKSGGIFIFCQIIFLIFLCYYFIQEFVKAIIQIKKALLKGKVSSENDKKGALGAAVTAVGDAAKGIRNKIKNVLIGVLNHIRDPWTFLNIVTIVGCFINVIIWFDARVNNPVEKAIQSLDMVEGIVINLTEEKKLIFSELNSLIRTQSGRLLFLYQISSITILIQVIKLVTYISAFVKPFSQIASIIIEILSRCLPFAILLLIILYSFSIMTSFYYGGIISELEPFLGGMLYFLTNLMNSFEYTEQIYQYDSTYAFFFITIFILVINFLLTSMYLIYVVHIYEEKMQEFGELKRNRRIPELFEFEPHLLWKIKNIFYSEVLVRYYGLFDKQKQGALKELLMKESKAEDRELAAYFKFNFDISLSKDTSEFESKLVFQNEITRFKINKAHKEETWGLVWSIIAYTILTILFLVVSLEHQKVTEGRNMIRSISDLLEQHSIVKVEQDRFKVYSYNKDLTGAQTIIDLLQWIQLFENMASLASYKLTTGEVYSGYFFGGTNYLFTDRYRLTIRRANVVPTSIGIWNSISKLTFDETFSYDERNPIGEFKDPVKGKHTNIWYNYSIDGTFLDNGGYVMYPNITEVVKIVNQTILDGLVDSSVAVVAIDFPIYQLTSLNVLNTAIVMEFDNSNNIYVAIEIELVGLNYYQSTSQYFIAFLEVLIFASCLYFLVTLISKIKKKAQAYNYWYSVHVSYFPAIMLRQRNKKCPEIVRKSDYIIDFREIMDLVFQVFMFVSIIIWIYYISLSSQIRNDISNFITKKNVPDRGEFQTTIYQAISARHFSRFTESVLIIAILIKIVYALSLFEDFKFIGATIQRGIFQIMCAIFILCIYLFGFAFFLHINIGIISVDYTNLIEVFFIVLQMLLGLDDKDRTLILTESSYKVFHAVFFFFPFVFWLNFIVSNIFLSTMIFKYKEYKVDQSKRIMPSLSVKEFLKITIEFFRKKKAKSKFGVEISEDVIKGIRGTEVFDEMGEITELCYHLRPDVKTWAVICTKTLMKEHESRTKIKKFAKEIRVSNQVEEETNPGVTLRKDVHLKTNEFKVRLKFWDYYRAGELELLYFMKKFTHNIEKLEYETSNRQLLQTRSQVDYKIKKYIFFLENHIAQNMDDVVKLRSKLDEFSIDSENNFHTPHILSPLNIATPDTTSYLKNSTLKIPNMKRIIEEEPETEARISQRGKGMSSIIAPKLSNRDTANPVAYNKKSSSQQSQPKLDITAGSEAVLLQNQSASVEVSMNKFKSPRFGNHVQFDYETKKSDNVYTNETDIQLSKRGLLGSNKIKITSDDDQDEINHASPARGEETNNSMEVGVNQKSYMGNKIDTNEIDMEEINIGMPKKSSIVSKLQNLKLKK